LVVVGAGVRECGIVCSCFVVGPLPIRIRIDNAR
jgi:hypothetical protein